MAIGFHEQAIPKGEFEMPKEIIFDEYTIAVADLDMALIQSYELSDIVYSSLEEAYRSDPAAIEIIQRVQQDQQDQVGKDFPYMDNLRNALGSPETMADPVILARQVADRNRDNSGRLDPDFVKRIMVPGSLEYLWALKNAEADMLVMTAGGEFSQRFKVELLRLVLTNEGVVSEQEDLSYIVTSSQRSKADLINAASEGGLLSIDKLAEVGVNGEGLAVASHLAPSLKGKEYKTAVLTDDKTSHLSPREEVPPYQPPRLVAIQVKRGGLGESGTDIGQLAEIVRSAA